MFDELLSSLTVTELKPRSALLETKERPTRKADIIALLRGHLLSPRLRYYWDKLESIDRLAVAEAIYNWGGHFDSVRFYKKYADLPGTFMPRRRGESSRPNTNGALPLFFYGGIVPKELRDRLKLFVPEPDDDTLKTVADENLPEDYSPKGQERSADPAASPFHVRRTALRDGGSTRLLRCSDAGIVRLLTSDLATRDHCLRGGGKLLIVPENAEKAFRDGLRKLGLVFPAG